MPVVSPLALAGLARAIGTPLGTRAARRLLHAMLTTEPSPTLVERIASRRPSGRAPAHADPLVHRFVSASTPPPSRAGRSAEGALAGGLVVVKDSLDVAGAPTAIGLRHHDARDVATQDSELVARIRAAGGVILGKGTMTELGIDGVGSLVPGGMPHNARVPGHVPGGSSTGTAVAVARGLARYGVGGDGLGSVRIPSALNGLVGLKPGHDVLSTRGYRSVSPSMDVPGPMTTTAADCARLYQVLAALEVRDLAPHVPSRVGILRGLGPELSSRDVRRAFDRVLDTLGVARIEVEIAGAPTHGALAVAAASSEGAVDHAHYFARARSGQGRLVAAVGRALGPEKERIAALRRALRDECLRALDVATVLAMPTTAVPAPAIRRGYAEGGFDPLLLRALGAYTPLANLTGLPAIAVPCGIDARGRPLSIMFMGVPGSEEELLGIAAAVEATGLGNRSV